MEKEAASAPVILHGSTASSGFAVGTIWLVTHRDLDIPSDRIPEEDVESQLQKASQVLRRIENQLRELQDTQRDREILEILDAQVQIIKDPELYNRVRQLIEEEQRSAEYALFRAFNEFIQLLRQTGQEWVKDRIIDLQSLRDKIIQQISGSDALQSLARGSIIFAEELSPTEVIEFSELEISAIVMQHGGTTSHSVIIAQSLGIPCVVGVNWRRSQLDGVDLAAIDAGRGEVIINPDGQMLSDFRGRREEAEAVDKNLIRISRLPSRTSCGSVFHLRANIEFEEELLRVRNYRAEGIGLLRTETLFLRQGYFDVKQHVLFYRNVLSGTGGHTVTVRLLDVGGDKLPGKRLEEPNPFLGWRGIRMLLDEEKLLNDQIEAILTVASEFPDRIRILMPMVSNVSEIIEVKRRIAGVRDRLNREGIPAPEIPAGIMIEVPSIAIQAADAAGAADFFSIGSNDLTQYVLAADRGNERVSGQFSATHPAVWKLIRTSYEAAEEAGIPISICGEMAGKPLLAAALLGMGINDLSMNPASIPFVKQLLCNYEIKIFKELLESILKAADGKGADAGIADWQKKYIN